MRLRSRDLEIHWIQAKAYVYLISFARSVVLKTALPINFLLLPAIPNGDGLQPHVPRVSRITENKALSKIIIFIFYFYCFLFGLITRSPVKRRQAGRQKTKIDQVQLNHLILRNLYLNSQFLVLKKR